MLGGIVAQTYERSSALVVCTLIRFDYRATWRRLGAHNTCTFDEMIEEEWGSICAVSVVCFNEGPGIDCAASLIHPCTLSPLARELAMSARPP